MHLVRNTGFDCGSMLLLESTVLRAKGPGRAGQTLATSRILDIALGIPILRDYTLLHCSKRPIRALTASHYRFLQAEASAN